MPDPQKASPKTPSKTPALIAAAVLVAAPLTATWEGLRTKPYADPGDGRTTVCYGETEREMRTYTAAECKALLREREAANYAPQVLKCVPGFAERRNAFAASIDAAYNAGWAAFCRSRMAKSFNAGDWEAGCNGFSGWYVTAGGKKLLGLVRRREAERALCLKDIAAKAENPPVQQQAPPPAVQQPKEPPPAPLTFWQRVGLFFRHLSGG